MNKTKLTAVVVTGVALAVFAYDRIHLNIIVKRFPNLDRQVVKEAYNLMSRRALSGAYNGMDESDETYDRIFLDIVKELASK